MRSLVRLVTACASQLVRVRLRVRLCLVAFRNRSRFATGIANTDRVSQQAAFRNRSRFRNRQRFATGRVSQQVAFHALSRSLLLQREER